MPSGNEVDMTLMTWVLMAVGLVVLTAGAECLVRGASKIAAAVGISPLVIGLTVVAYGTSAPELAVSTKSAWDGQSDIAMGNVVGSNIFNVLLILGACATLLPLKVHAQLIRLDVPIMIAASVLLLILGLDGDINRFDGLFLFALAVGYTTYIIRKSRRETREVQAEFAQEYGGDSARPRSRTLLDLGLVLLGLALLVTGARLFVDSAVTIAEAFGVSQLVIGLTIVAAGTSLPEVATSIVATLKGERDIAIGNVVGSNIFNILSVLGIASMIKPVAVAPAALTLDIPVMIAVAVACLPIFFTGLAIHRWEGLLFLGYYVAYTGYLILKAREHAAVPVFSEVMLVFIVPLTAITLVASSALDLRRKRRNSTG